MNTSSTFIGFDIGGTKIFVGLYDESFQLLDSVKVPTPIKGNPSALVKTLHSLCIRFIRPNTRAIGVGWAGFVDTGKGIIVSAPNIPGFENYPLRESLESRFHIPVCVENDANAFAFAEQQLQYFSVNYFLGIILGTGVGGGLIKDGDIFYGETFCATEIGHMVLDFKTLKEAESLFSASALSQLFLDAFGEGSLYVIEEWLESRFSDIERVLDPVLSDLAGWIYNLSLIYNPGKIVFGGGVGTHFLPHFENRLRFHIEKYQSKMSYPIHCDIGFSSLENAGALGAALLARKYISN